MVAGKRALCAADFRTRIDADALGLANLAAARIPGIVGQFEFRTDRTRGQHAALLEIDRDIKLVAVPEVKAAATAAAADAEIVDTFAVVFMVIGALIPFVHHEAAGALGPDIDAAADGSFALDQRELIHAMRLTVALPSHVVHALGDEPGIRFLNRAGRRRKRGSIEHEITPGLPGSEIGLEQEFVCRFAWIGRIVLRIQDPSCRAIHYGEA